MVTRVIGGASKYYLRYMVGDIVGKHEKIIKALLTIYRKFHSL